MFSDELYRRVLIDPCARQGADELRVVSGYSTANMVSQHMEFLSDHNQVIALKLVVGMAKRDGIERAQHLAFQKLCTHGASGSEVSSEYTVRGNPVHAKSYVWLRDGHPVSAFAGSANYTRTGFGRAQIECMSEIDPKAALDFFNLCRRNSADCLNDDIETMVAVTESRQVAFENEDAQDSVTLSLLDTRTGKTPQKSGVNWGQRSGRDKDQAYIAVPAPVQDQGFFPERGEQFTVLTDDGDSFIFVRAQDNGKALQTTRNNSEIGAYIRSRIGVRNGEFITREHLLNYGRTDITFMKLDEDTYVMDFRPNFGPGEDAEVWES